MNKKSLIKFYHDTEKGLMHYVIFERDIVVLSEVKTKKVEYINKHGKLNISFNVDSKSFDEVDVSIVTDKEYVGKVYNYMHEINNAYFFDGYDTLCVVKFDRK